MLMLLSNHIIKAELLKFAIMYKGFAKITLCITLTFSMLSAAIPLHNVFHNHYFIKIDDCAENTCKSHLKNHTEHCHTHSDAVFLADLPKEIVVINLLQNVKQLQNFFKEDNYFQFFFLTKNKAPPALITA